MSADSRTTAGGVRRFVPAMVGVALVGFMALLPMLNLSLAGILPTPTYMPGTLALLSLCMVFAALALSYNLLLGSGGMLSFGHALYFGAGAYGLGSKGASRNVGSSGSVETNSAPSSRTQRASRSRSE